MAGLDIILMVKVAEAERETWTRLFVGSRGGSGPVSCCSGSNGSAGVLRDSLMVTMSPYSKMIFSRVNTVCRMELQTPRRASSVDFSFTVRSSPMRNSRTAVKPPTVTNMSRMKTRHISLTVIWERDLRTCDGSMMQQV